MARRAASMLVAFESLTNRTPPTSADRLERVLEAGESFDRARHRAGSDPGERRHRRGGEDVGHQMRPDQADRRQRHERLDAPTGAPDDRVAVEHDAVGERPLHREQQPSCARAVRAISSVGGSSAFSTAQSSSVCLAKIRAFAAAYSSTSAWRSR